MKQLADGLFMIPVLPPYGVNAYLVDGVLIDAGMRSSAPRILRMLRGHAVTGHALTHAHPDHQGGSHAVCEALGIPLSCGAADADAVEDPSLVLPRLPNHWLNRTIAPRWTGPAHPVAQRLREGDTIGGLVVLETPGHSAGHVVYWRASDRVLIVGDVLINMHLLTGLSRLGEPARVFTPDAARNRQSARRLAALEPALVCFGHGPPLRNTKKFVNFLARLPD